MSISTLIATLPLVYLAVIAIPLVSIDLRQHRLPNKLVLPLFPIALVTDITASFISGEWWRLGLALALAFSIFTLGMVANYFDVLGMGDVKLLSATALVTAWFIWWLPLAVIGGTLVLSILVIIYKVFIGKTRLGDNIPLGPYAVALALIFGTLGVLSI